MHTDYLLKSWHAAEEQKLFNVGEICFYCKGVEIIITSGDYSLRECLLDLLLIYIT